MGTDKAIQQFTDAFAELRTRFRDRLNLDSWKVASVVKDGVVHLVATTERLKEIGERDAYIMLLAILMFEMQLKTNGLRASPEPSSVASNGILIGPACLTQERSFLMISWNGSTIQSPNEFFGYRVPLAPENRVLPIVLPNGWTQSAALVLPFVSIETS